MTSTTPLPVTTGRRSGRSSGRSSSLSLHGDDGAPCGFMHSTAFMILAAIGLATLVTLTLLNAHVHGLTGGIGGGGPPGAARPGAPLAPAAAGARLLAALPPGGVVTLPPGATTSGAASSAGGAPGAQAPTAGEAGGAGAPAGGGAAAAGAGGGPPLAPPPSAAAPPPKPFRHPFPEPKYKLYSIPPRDPTARCSRSGICDGDHSCGPDKLGCVVSSRRRQDHIREAIRWSWQGYRCGRKRRSRAL
jgi:hypothetical protein